MTGRLAFVVGLKSEARIAGGLAFVGGGGADGARRAAHAAAASGATMLLSFGLAGGLSPFLPAGSLLVPRCVLWRDKRYPTSQQLGATLGGINAEYVLGGTGVVADRAEKARLWKATGAEIIDLESGPVAEAATLAGLPFAVLRVVCDAADHSLPPVAQLALDQAGTIRIGQVAASLLRQPGQLRRLVLLARDAGRARRALKQKVAALRAIDPSGIWE